MLVPTPRLLVLTLAGIIPMLGAGSHQRALIVAAVWFALIVTAALFDARLVLPAARLQWKREHDSKLSLGRWNPASLSVLNATRRRLVFEVRDAHPNHLLADGNWARGTCAPEETWTLQYRLLPVRRGAYHIGPVAARFLGPLGLVWVQGEHDIDSDVHVYPDLLAIQSYESVMQHGQLQEIGLRNSRRRGLGTEFERLRDYTPDDEYRRINWKATARRHQLVVADYQTERSQNIMIVLDAGRLMSTRLSLPVEVPSARNGLPDSSHPIDGSDKEVAIPVALTRLDHAVNAAVLLAFVSQRAGDRVGLLAFSDRILRYLPVKSGRAQFIQVTHDVHDLEAEPFESDYDTGLGYLAQRSRRRSLLVLFTDLTEQDAADRLLANIGHLAQRHLPLVVTLRDPGVERLATVAPRTLKQVYERAVAGSLLDSRADTLRYLRQRGALTLDVPADGLSASVINRYLEIKARAAL